MRLSERIGALCGHGVRDLYPGYFAMVMATGIISVDGVTYHHSGISLFLLVWAVAAYLILIGLYLWRAVRYWPNFAADLRDASKNPGFLTFAAGTNILGARLVLAHAADLAFGLLGVGFLAWLVFIYNFFAADMFRNKKPAKEVLTGAWLLLTVSSQSVAILATMLAFHHPADAPALLFSAYSFWCIGVFLYTVVIGFIIYRVFFYPVNPADIDPTYWINMGAVAISVRAGALLMQSAAANPFLASVEPLLTGLTVMLWAWGTWWIPLLFMMSFWRYVVRRDPLAYNPAFWGMIFPMGMYTAATGSLGQALHLTVLFNFAGDWLWLAMAAWTCTALGFLWSNLRRLRSGLAAPPVTVARPPQASAGSGKI